MFKITAIPCYVAVDISDQLNMSHVMIRITDPRNDFPPLKDNPNRVAVLELKFYDLDGNKVAADWSEEDINKYGHGLFTMDQAVQIVDFIQTHNPDKVIVHCDAGISRSAGVAAAIAKVITGSDEVIFNDNRYIPNRYVYRKLLDSFHERGMI
jgi:predicted protein tyrosine phosphatase